MEAPLRFLMKNVSDFRSLRAQIMLVCCKVGSISTCETTSLYAQLNRSEALFSARSAAASWCNESETIAHLTSHKYRREGFPDSRRSLSFTRRSGKNAGARRRYRLLDDHLVRGHVQTTVRGPRLALANETRKGGRHGCFATATSKIHFNPTQRQSVSQLCQIVTDALSIIS